MDFPNEFIVRTKLLLGENFPALEDALQKEAPVSIRLNSNKLSATPSYEKVSWCNTGYYLQERPSFTFDPLFHAGCYYVQEASSMFLEQAIKQYIPNPAICLDLCAAPGGKSTHLASILPTGSLLVSNEVIRSRSVILAENTAKWGMPDTIVTSNDPKEIGKLTHLFDVIVADLPCSGEGMFRKDPESRNEWSIANVQLCATRQRRIIHDIWNALKPGGLLIYSTCTFNREENEENIQYLANTLNAEALPISVGNESLIYHAIQSDLPAYRFLPHLTKGEGFFIAILRKPESEKQQISSKNKKKQKQAPLPVPATVKDWITGYDRYQFFTSSNGSLQAIPVDHFDTYQFITETLHVISAGIPVGEVKGKDLVPTPALAFNLAFNQMSFTRVDLQWEEAIRFLQKEALTLPADIPKGFTLITFRNQPLGFVKNIGNRANNLYPQEWRIRSKHLPETMPNILQSNNALVYNTL
ncbi:MAG: rRNA cytosine-C5-methyltransferase [Tannerella sp.]|jgi:16S rRNA C967 or C1407 C5-methylase (RsmB/RsmF family)/NOL1/NOP2/fmu family ribosome biogenesis protein|nr:rRNA cytosine-C5-methyltransferase [Tannerella sp.]